MVDITEKRLCSLVYYTVTVPITRNYDKDFFKTWSSEMAYVLGFLYADGNVVKTKRGTHFVAVYSADKEILVKMRNVFKSNHSISARRSSTGCVYRIQIGSKEWFADVSKLGLTPGKVRRMTLPKIPKPYFGDFVRGYFDGDGNVWVGIMNKNRTNPNKVLMSAFTSSSHAYLEALHQNLLAAGLRGGSLYRSKKDNFSRLSLSVQDSLKLHEIMYNGAHKLYLKRKKLVFDGFVKMRW